MIIVTVCATANTTRVQERSFEMGACRVHSCPIPWASEKFGYESENEPCVLSESALCSILSLFSHAPCFISIWKSLMSAKSSRTYRPQLKPDGHLTTTMPKSLAPQYLVLYASSPLKRVKMFRAAAIFLLASFRCLGDRLW